MGLRRRFFEWLLRAVKAFFAWNTRTLVRLTVRRAGIFRQWGQWKKGSDEIMKVAGLESSDLEDPARVLEKLRSKLEDVGPELAAAFFLQLTTFLVDEGSSRLVAALFELDAKIEPGDYTEPARLAHRLRERTRDLPPAFAASYIFQLGNVLGLVSRPEDEQRVLEAHLGLQPGDYMDRERLGVVLSARPEEIPPDLWAMTIQMLAANLGKAGRWSELVAVLQAALGLDTTDYAHPEVLRRKMRAALGPLAAASSVGYVSVLSSSLQDLGFRAQALALVEADFDLEPADYGDRRRLADKVRARMQRLPPEMTPFLLIPLLGALIFAQRAEDGAAVLAAHAGFDLSSSTPEELTAALRARCRSMPRDAIGFYLGMAAFVLASADRPLDAVAALETDADLMTIDWQDADALAQGLEERLGKLAPIARLHYVGQLLSALEVAGREERAAFLVDACVRKLLPLHQDDSSDLAPLYCILYESWLTRWAEDGSRQPVEVCRTMLPSLRLALAAQGVTLQDRERYIRSVSDLRRRIVQTGLYWAAQESDSAQAEELRRTVLLWDLELAQRLLVERFMLTEIHVVPRGEAPLAGVWPLPEARPVTPDYLPDSAEVLAATGVFDKVVGS